MPDPSLRRPANTLRFGIRILGTGRGRVRLPCKVNLMVTSRCNQRCATCRIWAGEARDLPLSLVSGLLDSVPSLPWLDVTGGEILLRPDIEELFEAILKSSRRLSLFHFPTNGSLPDRAVRLARSARSGTSARLVITVSLDGPPELHDAIRGVHGAWEEAMETFRRLREVPDCRVYLGMTLSGDNLTAYRGTLDAAAKAVPGIGPADLHVNVAHASEHYYRTAETKPVDRDAMAAVLGKIAAARGRSFHPLGLVERRYLRLAPEYLRTGRSPIPCRALLATCFVDAAGTVYPCVSWDRPLGSLSDTGGDLRPIWNSPAAAEAREFIAREACPGCWTPCEAVPAILGSLLRPRTWRTPR